MTVHVPFGTLTLPFQNECEWHGTASCAACGANTLHCAACRWISTRARGPERRRAPAHGRQRPLLARHHGVRLDARQLRVVHQQACRHTTAHATCASMDKKELFCYAPRAERVQTAHTDGPAIVRHALASGSRLDELARVGRAGEPMGMTYTGAPGSARHVGPGEADLCAFTECVVLDTWRHPVRLRPRLHVLGP